MTTNANDIAATARRVLGLQLIVGVIGAVIFFLAKGSWGAAVSALYGSLISIATTLLLSWGVRRAEGAAAVNPAKSQAILYLGAVQRFVAVLALFLFGLAVLELDPLATVVGFALAHIANLITLAGLRK